MLKIHAILPQKIELLILYVKLIHPYSLLLFWGQIQILTAFD